MKFGMSLMGPITTKKAQSIAKILDPFWAIFWWRHFSVQIPVKIFSKSSEKRVLIVPSKRSWTEDDENGVICKILSFRPPKMVQCALKSEIFIGDVIGYEKILHFQTKVKR